jgi:3-hydroxymyristoyl/3-hydroxydecanoyl-(acyl carrier protein) dehydratase
MNELVVSDFMVPAEHPALAGHFPGRPIVPGVMLLDAVRAAVSTGADTLRGIPSAKFLQAVLPGERIELRIELSHDVDGLRARFRGLRAETVVFEGSFLFARGGSA